MHRSTEPWSSFYYSCPASWHLRRLPLMYPPLTKQQQRFYPGISAALAFVQVGSKEEKPHLCTQKDEPPYSAIILSLMLISLSSKKDAVSRDWDTFSRVKTNWSVFLPPWLSPHLLKQLSLWKQKVRQRKAMLTRIGGGVHLPHFHRRSNIFHLKTNFIPNWFQFLAVTTPGCIKLVKKKKRQPQNRCAIRHSLWFVKNILK